MAFRDTTRTATTHHPPLRSFTDDAGTTTGITVYGCAADEAAAFREAARRRGVALTMTESPIGEQFTALAGGNRCVSVSHRTPVPEPVLRALRRAGVRYLSTRSVGVDHIDVRGAERVGITVGTVAYSPDSVADYTLMLMLMSIRHAVSTVRRTDLHDYRLDEARGRELRDLTVGVVGTGRIGRAVLDRLRGFGCRTLACDARPSTRAEYVGLDELVSTSDIVTLHTPLAADTHHLLDRHRIGRMRRGAIVVNTARGALVDTDALVSALERGRLGGAALDVVEGEDGLFATDRRTRPVGNSPLLRLQQLPNVVISPHTAYYTGRALQDVVENTITNCLTFDSEGAPWTD